MNDAPTPLTEAIAHNAARYRDWRRQKLIGAEKYSHQSPLAIKNPRALSQKEITELGARIKAVNFACYHTAEHDALLALCQQLGLKKIIANPFSDSSGVTEIHVADDARREYVPYQNRALNWHTDGYYNAPASRIHSFAMHTVRAAARGGENQFLDVEMLYLLLRDCDRSLADCLFAQDVMTIPAARANVSPRPARTGAVFEFADGRLQMAFTLRTRNIHWKESREVQDALAAIRSILSDDNPHIHKIKFAAGDGVISNNVLHNRSAFTDDGDGRLVLRVRFADCLKV